MAGNRLPQQKITTPIGRAVWPHLHAPDTAFDSAGVYTIGIQLSADEALPIIRAIEKVQAETMKAVQEETKKKQKPSPYQPYTENEDGSYTFNFKMKASGTRKDGTTWERAPALFDAAGGKVAAGTRVGGGSQVRVAGVISGYKAPFGVGVSLKLDAVQIIELVTFGGSSADDFGFSAVEGGFTGSASGANEEDDTDFSGGSVEDDDLPADF